MQTTRLICALASAALLCGSAPARVAAQTTPPATATTTPLVPGTPALDLRELRARRTAHGYVLTGEALVNDPCQAARFDSSLLTIYPPQFNLDQFRSPKKMGMMCIQRLAWVAAEPRMVTSAKPPAYVTVRAKEAVVRVPVR
jgi:hypothetical protein